MIGQAIHGAAQTGHQAHGAGTAAGLEPPGSAQSSSIIDEAINKGTIAWQMPFSHSLRMATPSFPQ